ncbi:unnamed protein product [Pleuronectes platessa]|uniref:Uncharacterized protein n=1 Tax=Pleuronectes platessa TaxID=8262 RepID=A0A9N7YVD2_PLEPL|nr:unnamed protein product [Pleuronectes platessa]
MPNHLCFLWIFPQTVVSMCIYLFCPLCLYNPASLSIPLRPVVYQGHHMACGPTQLMDVPKQDRPKSEQLQYTGQAAQRRPPLCNHEDTVSERGKQGSEEAKSTSWKMDRGRWKKPARTGTRTPSKKRSAGTGKVGTKGCKDKPGGARGGRAKREREQV